MSPQNRSDTHDFHKSKTAFFFLPTQKGVAHREEEEERNEEKKKGERTEGEEEAKREQNLVVRRTCK